MNVIRRKVHQIKKYLVTNIDMTSIYLGVVKGYNVKMLPTKMYVIYNNMYIRILRVIGGFFLLLVITKLYLMLPVYSHVIVIVLGILQSIQIIIIFIIKVIYGIYVLKYKKNEFDVRNSPLNHCAIRIARILYCAKISCAVTGGTAATIAAGAFFNFLLEIVGKENFNSFCSRKTMTNIFNIGGEGGGTPAALDFFMNLTNIETFNDFQKLLVYILILSLISL